jgi:ribosomal protein S18 acetylase RimI-like enzyme
VDAGALMSDTVEVFIEAWKLMTARFASHRIQEGDGVASCFGNVPLLFFNLWVQSRPVASSDELRALLATGKERAAECAHPTGGILRVDWLPAGWEVSVQEAGLARTMTLTGMESGPLLAARRPAAAIEIRRVADDVGARDLAMVNARAYDMPLELFDCMANIGWWGADSFGYVGYVDGKPVSTAAALPVAGTVYIALVATMPEAQSKGYAETVMRHAVTQGQRSMGTMRTTLHASDKGRPVYAAMGYVAVGEFALVAAAKT